MVVRQSLLALFCHFSSLALLSTGNADDWLDISDYQLTSVCSDTVQKYELAQFQIETDPYYMHEISLRDPDAELDIQGRVSRGWL